MNETEFRETAQPSAQPGNATGETMLLSVDDAAAVLGISPQAVRKRISKGQLTARRDGRAWLVILERVPGSETSATSATETGETTAQPRTKPPQPERNLVSHQQAEQWAAMVAPFLERIESLTARMVAAELRSEDAEERAAALEIAGDVTAARLADVERERDELRARLAELESRENAQETRQDGLGTTEPPHMNVDILQAVAALPVETPPRKWRDRLPRLRGRG